MKIPTTKVQKWDVYFLTEAALISTRSKDPSTQTGAVIVAPNKEIISKGYNGLPVGMPDEESYYSDRTLKLETILHCEVNAQIFATQPLTGCTLYTWPLLSCSRCASQMIQAGITRVVAPYNEIERWEENLQLSKKSFRSCGVEIVEYDKSVVLTELRNIFDKIGLN